MIRFVLQRLNQPRKVRRPLSRESVKNLCAEENKYHKPHLHASRVLAELC
jgi:hypothetical protein